VRAVIAVELEETLSWGVFGLLEAVETYDPGRRTKLESYAISKIRWAILDELRRLDPVTRRVRRRAREVESAWGELAQRLGRTPSEEEVASEVGAGVAEHRAFLARLWLAQVGSLEVRAEGDYGSGHDLHQTVADTLAVDPAPRQQRWPRCGRGSSRPFRGSGRKSGWLPPFTSTRG
jgi:RNA polymerase sigma factor for flagellar operon FliA